MRVPQSKRRHDDLRSLKFYRGWLTIEERLELARLGKQLRQQERRRERYASDPEYAQRYRDNERRWRLGNASA